MLLLVLLILLLGHCYLRRRNFAWRSDAAPRRPRVVVHLVENRRRHIREAQKYLIGTLAQCGVDRRINRGLFGELGVELTHVVFAFQGRLIGRLILTCVNQVPVIGAKECVGLQRQGVVRSRAQPLHGLLFEQFFDEISGLVGQVGRYQ